MGCKKGTRRERKHSSEGRETASCASHALQFSRLCSVIRICGVAVLLCPNFELHDPCEK